MGNCHGRRRRRRHPRAFPPFPIQSLEPLEYSGSSSDGTAGVADAKGFCPICLEEKELSCFYNQEHNENFQINPCNHQFCKECFSTHVNTVIDSGAWQVRCPGESCKYVLSAKDIEHILPPFKYKTWQDVRNSSFYERFMSNDQHMRDALQVDKLVEREIKRREIIRQRLKEQEELEQEAMKLDKGGGNSKIDGVALRHGVRVRATYLSNTGPRYRGTILEVSEVTRTASIIYDDGDFWGFVPFGCIEILRISRLQQLKRRNNRITDFYPRMGECAFPELMENVVLKEEDIVVGKRVMAGYTNGEFYPGVIASVNRENKTASIDYDDGDVWGSCPFSQIQEHGGDLKCCPQCAVIIYKYDGCDSMTCLCGKGFDWKRSYTIPQKVMDELVEKELEKRVTAAKAESDDAFDDGESTETLFTAPMVVGLGSDIDSF